MRIRPYIISGLALLLVPPVADGQNQAIGIEQTTPGTKPGATLGEAFDGLGAEPFATSAPRNPSDNSLAIGPDHIMQAVNSQLVVFSKTGNALFRWMASAAMDRYGNIGIGYSFGGTPQFRDSGLPAGKRMIRLGNSRSRHHPC